MMTFSDEVKLRNKSIIYSQTNDDNITKNTFFSFLSLWTSALRYSTCLFMFSNPKSMNKKRYYLVCIIWQWSIWKEAPWIVPTTNVKHVDTY